MKKSTRSFRKGTALIMAFVIMLSLMLTGCDVKQLFQEMATDYVQVEIQNQAGTLLSESSNNEQIYTYQIDADISNNYALDLTNATVTLNVPSNVEITNDGNKQEIKENNIKVQEIKSYSWVVKIPMTFDDQNIDYSVSVKSDVSNQVEAFGLLWVDGKNKNDNRLNFDVDTWKFENYGEKPIPLLQEDYNALVVGYDNASKESIKTIISENAGGYCYGMAATSILAKMNRLNERDIDANTDNLHDISKNDKSKSVIGYYWITQCFSIISDEKAAFMRKSTTEKLQIIEEKAKNVESGGNPFIFSFYSQPNGKGGHAVVGYSHEGGSFKWNGKKYDSRILIYDSNYPKWTEKSCLYYNKGTADWYIPNYPNSSEITRALSDLNIMDIKNIETSKKSVNSYVTAKGNEQLNIYTTDGVLIGKVDGISVSDNSNIVAYRNDGVDDILMIAIPKSTTNNAETSYVFKTDKTDEEVDISIEYDNFYLSAVGTEQKSITFNPNGNVEVEGNTTDFSIEITANEGYYSTDWHKLSVSGDSGVNPKIELVDGGYILSGDDLKDVKVLAQNEKTANKLSLKTDEETVFITQEGENLCVKTDEDEDGKYETILVTGTKTTPDDPTSGGSGFSIGSIFGNGFNFGGTGSVDLWLILLIAGVLLLSAAIATIAIVFNSKKKKNKEDKFVVPEITNDENVKSENPQADEQAVESITEGIVILNGTMANKQFSISDGQILNIGKDKNIAHIVFDSSYSMVSRIHCTVTYNAKFDKYFVTDCSTNGMYYDNGQRLQKGVRTSIIRGTILRLADENCLIKFI